MTKQALCHPDKPNGGRGLCAACYGRMYRSPDYIKKPGRVPQQLTCGHQERRPVGYGLCASCYAKHLRATSRKYSKDVRKDGALKRRYGISLYQKRIVLDEQEWKCPLCRCNLSDNEHEKSNAHVDHCHVTGRIRGVLCYRCNNAIAILGDNAAGLRRAIEYLEEPIPSVVNLNPSHSWRKAA